MKIEKDIITSNERVKLSNGTVVNLFTHIVAGAEIGADCMIGEHCYVAKTAIIGDRCRIQNHNSIWDGVILGNDVFIAPGAGAFTNHHNPHERHNRKQFIADKTIVEDGATICANSIIIAPKTIGENSMIAAGSLVRINVPASTEVYGMVRAFSNANKRTENGEKINGYVDNSGNFIRGTPPVKPKFGAVS